MHKTLFDHEFRKHRGLRDGRSMSPVIDLADRDEPAHHNGRNSRDAWGVRLGHVHLKVRSLDRALPFYTSFLDLRLTERTGRFAFLAAGAEHHSVALEEVGDWAGAPSRRAVGMAHLAFEVPDRATFFRKMRTLSEAGIPYISRNNGISWAARFKDPDGHEVEIYVDRRRARDGASLWEGRWHYSFNMEEPAREPIRVAA